MIRKRNIHPFVWINQFISTCFCMDLSIENFQSIERGYYHNINRIGKLYYNDRFWCNFCITRILHLVTFQFAARRQNLVIDNFVWFFSQKPLAFLSKICKVGFKQLHLLGWVRWSGWCLATPYWRGRKVHKLQRKQASKSLIIN